MTLYDWGLDIGGMERSRYFGFSKDLSAPSRSAPLQALVPMVHHCSVA